MDPAVSAYVEQSQLYTVAVHWQQVKKLLIICLVYIKYFMVPYWTHRLVKTPVHTLALSGPHWLQELRSGHLCHIHENLRMDLRTFEYYFACQCNTIFHINLHLFICSAFVNELSHTGLLPRSCYMNHDEQVAIF